MIIILSIASCLLLAVVLGRLIAVRFSAPEGYEDEHGFHYGSVPKLEARGLPTDGIEVGRASEPSPVRRRSRWIVRPIRPLADFDLQNIDAG